MAAPLFAVATSAPVEVRARPLLDAVDLRARLEEEVARSRRYGRPLAIAVLDLGDNPTSCEEALRSLFRSVDVLGRLDARSVVAVLPETGESGAIPLERALAALAATVPGVRAGLAIAEGSDASALIAVARDAASRAARGTFVVGERRGARELAGESIVIADPSMQRLFSLVERLAASDLPVLIGGETGAGKEIVAKALHAWSPRKNKRLVSLNCAAVPDTLLESELFGHEKGAFSGAGTARAGLLESADGGTLFLDEIGECSPLAQAKLLRVLETKRFTRVGSASERAADVRIVTATNRSLDADVKTGKFRRDLFFRLNAASIEVPPLRSRPLDVAPLARAFLAAAAARLGRTAIALAPGAIDGLVRHDFPGNVRQLKNAMDYFAAAHEGSELTASDVDAHLGVAPTPPSLPREPTAAFACLADEVRDLEARRMTEALLASGGVRMRAASLIGMPLRTFVTKLRLYAIDVPTPRTKTRRR